MGSFTFPSPSEVKPPSPLSAMRRISATCNVTNRIDIDKYFEALKHEVTKTENTNKESKRGMRKCDSASQIDVLKSPKGGVSSSAARKSLNKLKMSTRKLGSSFDYDLSGQMIDGNNNIRDKNCLMSRQKSWDLSYSKIKIKEDELIENANCDIRMDSNNNNIGLSDEVYKNDLSASYSAGDFKSSFTKSRFLAHSKSLESMSDLHLRHHENAMAHGNISSVSEQNRRHRRKYYRKKKHSNEKDNPKLLADSIDRKLSLS